MLTQAKKDYFKGLLNVMLREALYGNRDDEKDKREVSHADPSDRATAELENNLSLKMRERNNGLVRKIEQALAKIDNGAFGICVRCEEEIPESRLNARPIATLCIACKRKQEADEAKRI